MLSRSSRTGGVGDPDTADLMRRVANVVRLGTIVAADYATAKARVKIGELTTDWLPWMTLRAGGDVTWWAPEVDEQVLVLSPSGELTQGVILAALYQTSIPANGDRPTLHRTTYADGAVIEYDREAHVLRATIPGDAVVTAEKSITASAGTDVTVIAASAVTVTGNESVSVSSAGPVSIASAGQVTVSAPTVNIDGGEGGGAMATLRGNFSLRGNLKVEGSVAVSGNIDAGGQMTDAGGNTNHHTHGD